MAYQTTQQQDSLKALLNNQSLSGSYGRTSDLLAQDTDQYGRYDPQGGSRYTANTEAALQDDPWAEHYADSGTAQSEAQIEEDTYNRPGQQQQRGDVFEEDLGLIREKAGHARDAAAVTAGAKESQFQRSQATQRRGQNMNQGKTGLTQAGQDRRAGNQILEAQAKAAQTNGRSSANPMSWLFGQPTGEEQAAQFRSQQQVGTQGDAAPGTAPETPDFSNPQLGDTAEDEQGRPLQYDGVGWAYTDVQ